MFFIQFLRVERRNMYYYVIMNYNIALKNLKKIIFNHVYMVKSGCKTGFASLLRVNRVTHATAHNDEET